MFWVILTIITIGFFIIKLKKPKSVSKPVVNPRNTTIKKTKKILSIDEQIDNWSNKKRQERKENKGVVVHVPPSSNISLMHFLALCHDCSSLFSLDENIGSCPCCSSPNLLFGYKSKILSGRWFGVNNTWAISKESAFPERLLNIKKKE